MSRQERIKAILKRLRDEDYPSPNDLADSLGVCAKTVQRDLRYMRDKLKFLIKYDEIEKGWELIGKAFPLTAAFISKQDLQALLILGNMVAQYGGTPLGNSMENAFARVLELFGDSDDVEKVRALAKRVRFIAAPAPRIEPAHWQSILIALQQDQRLEIVYRKGGSGEAASRKFDPYGLIVRNREWYLHGYCHNKKKALTFFVPYISEMSLLDEYFDVPPDFDLAAYCQAGFMGLQAGKEPIRQIVLRFAPHSVGAARSAPFMPDQSEVLESSGHLRVTFKTNALFALQRELLRWSADVEVLEPKQLRNEIRESVNAMNTLYRKPHPRLANTKNEGKG